MQKTSNNNLSEHEGERTDELWIKILLIAINCKFIDFWS